MDDNQESSYSLKPLEEEVKVSIVESTAQVVSLPSNHGRNSGEKYAEYLAKLTETYNESIAKMKDTPLISRDSPKSSMDGVANFDNATLDTNQKLEPLYYPEIHIDPVKIEKWNTEVYKPEAPRPDERQFRNLSSPSGDNLVTIPEEDFKRSDKDLDPLFNPFEEEGNEFVNALAKSISSSTESSPIEASMWSQDEFFANGNNSNLDFSFLNEESQLPNYPLPLDNAMKTNNILERDEASKAIEELKTTKEEFLAYAKSAKNIFLTINGKSQEPLTNEESINFRSYENKVQKVANLIPEVCKIIREQLTPDRKRIWDERNVEKFDLSAFLQVQKSTNFKPENLNATPKNKKRKHKKRKKI